MKQAIDELINCLAMEKDIYQNCLNLSLLKKDAIIKGDINNLDKIVDDERSLVITISSLEEKRLKIVSRISGDENITVADVIKIVQDDGQKHRLLALVQGFDGIIEECRSINSTNYSMIKNNLNYISFMMNSILSGDKTYGGKKTGGQKINIFDERV